ncbi:MAG: MBL fold metallo-hydrolase [Dehalococcoidales bacterium]|nr:MBL fold metallo-hydrolase [Dehalococcoidales bacterium]
MKIKWLGHASFLITSDTGIRIITDPYVIGGPLSYGEIKESADIVTVSHEHGDHNNVAAVRGNPKVIRETTKARDIDFRGIPTYHDAVSGSKRGKNTVFCFDVDGIRVCHLGDLGHQLDDKEAISIGKVDILLVPVGGNYTIDSRIATEVCNKLATKVVIPMHYKNQKCNYPIAGIDEFLQGKTGVNRLDTSEVEYKVNKLPGTTQIIVLVPAL